MILVNLSGGIDSTFALWRYLTDDVAVAVHHCHMENSEHRASAETAATADVLAWLASGGLVPVEAIETSMDVSAVKRLTDPQVIGFLTGLICRERRDLEVALTYSASDRPARDPSIEWFARGPRFAEQLAGRTITWHWPLRDLTKPQIIAAMPPDLLDRCWTCRRPENGRPCRRCATCRRLRTERVEAQQ